jgi:hypothetical protein
VVTHKPWHQVTTTTAHFTVGMTNTTFIQKWRLNTRDKLLPWHSVPSRKWLIDLQDHAWLFCDYCYILTVSSAIYYIHAVVIIQCYVIKQLAFSCRRKTLDKLTHRTIFHGWSAKKLYFDSTLCNLEWQLHINMPILARSQNSGLKTRDWLYLLT